MSDPQIPDPKSTQKPTKIPTAGEGFSNGRNFTNPPDSMNPDAATLRDQWRFAIRQYSKWYSHAWGTAILAGLSFFALGWIVKGSNPLPSFKPDNPNRDNSSSSSTSGDKDQAAAAAAQVHQPR